MLGTPDHQAYVNQQDVPFWVGQNVPIPLAGISIGPINVSSWESVLAVVGPNNADITIQYQWLPDPTIAFISDAVTDSIPALGDYRARVVHRGANLRVIMVPSVGGTVINYSFTNTNRKTPLYSNAGDAPLARFTSLLVPALSAVTVALVPSYAGEALLWFNTTATNWIVALSSRLGGGGLASVWQVDQTDTSGAQKKFPIILSREINELLLVNGDAAQKAFSGAVIRNGGQ